MVRARHLEQQPERLQVELAPEGVARHHRQLAALRAALRRLEHLAARGVGRGGEVAAEAEPAQLGGAREVRTRILPVAVEADAWWGLGSR